MLDNYLPNLLRSSRHSNIIHPVSFVETVSVTKNNRSSYNREQSQCKDEAVEVKAFCIQLLYEVYFTNEQIAAASAQL